jgi:hypothetical protein
MPFLWPRIREKHEYALQPKAFGKRREELARFRFQEMKPRQPGLFAFPVRKPDSAGKDIDAKAKLLRMRPGEFSQKVAVPAAEFEDNRAGEGETALQFIPQGRDPRIATRSEGFPSAGAFVHASRLHPGQPGEKNALPDEENRQENSEGPAERIPCRSLFPALEWAGLVRGKVAATQLPEISGKVFCFRHEDSSLS